MNRFIDDVSVLAIEDCLISKLSTLFRSSNVLNMEEEEISRLAGETEESSQERKRLEAKSEVLEKALRDLKNLLKRRNVLHLTKQDQETSKDSEPTASMTPNGTEEEEEAPIATSEPEWSQAESL